MKRSGCGRFRGMLVGLMLAAAAVSVSGCGARHEAIVIESRTAEHASTAHQAMTEIAGTSFAEIREKEVPRSAEKAVVMIPVDELVYVTGDRVNVRTKADMDGEILAKVNSGIELRRIGYHEAWSQVEYLGQLCYISSRYVSPEKPAAEGVEPDAQEKVSNGQAGPGMEATAADDQGGPEMTEATANSRSEAAAQGTGSGSQSSMGTAASGEEIQLDSSWKYAEFSKINTGTAGLYRSEAAVRKNITICVNAGHGTSGGSGVKTLCHPDGTPKVTGGTTGAGATTAVAVSGGMTFADGTPEAQVTLAMAKILKEKLLAAGYDVLMIRESDDVQLDNIARTVIANNRADCHIALHWDSTSSDKGAFYMSVPGVESYRNMEPVKSNWQKHNALGDSLVAGLKNAGVKIFSGGAMEMDLTQTSYSTIPSVDMELGDKASDHSDTALQVLADGLVDGVNRYFGP